MIHFDLKYGSHFSNRSPYFFMAINLNIIYNENSKFFYINIIFLFYLIICWDPLGRGDGFAFFSCLKTKCYFSLFSTI